MARPESTVYLRREGTGDAQIFGAPANALAALQNLGNIRMQQQARQSEFARMEKERRDQKMAELIERDPEKTFQPFNDQLLNAAKTHRQSVIDRINRGDNWESPEFKAWNKGEWSKLDDIARRGNWVKDEITIMRDLVKKDPYLNTEYYWNKINDLYMDEFGNGKPIEQVDVNAIRNVTLDPGGFKMDEYAKSFMKNIEENVFNFHQQQLKGWGIDDRDVKVKIKADLYTPDPNTKSGVAEDEEGNPIINASKDFVSAFTSNENARRWIEQQAKQQGVDPKQIIEQVVRPRSSFEKTQQSNSKMFSKAWLDGGANEEGATRRLQNVSALAYAFTDDEGFVSDKPNAEAERVLGYIKNNAKLNGTEITDARFVKGDEDINTFDRIEFTTKAGARAIPKKVVINLNDPVDATAQLNSIFETAKTEGGFKIGHDELMDIDESKFQGQYLNRNRKTKPGSLDEQKAIRAAQTWAQGNQLEKLNNLRIGKQTIASAKFSSPIIGSDKLTLVFTDGSSRVLNPKDSEDLKVLKQAYESQFSPKVEMAGKRGSEVLNEDFWKN